MAHFSLRTKTRFARSLGRPHCTAQRSFLLAISWVAVKELKLSYHNGYIYIYSRQWGFPNIVT